MAFFNDNDVDMTLPQNLPKFEGKEEDYPVWLAQFSAALLLSKVETPEEKRALLLISLAPSVVRTLIAICNQRRIACEVDFDELLLKLELHYRRKPIQLAEYQRLFGLRQQPGQSPSEFAAQIGQIAGHCNFPIDLARAEAIVFSMGYKDDRIRQQLIMKDHKTMETALEQARQLEAVLRESAGDTRPTNSSELLKIQQFRKAETTASPCYRCGRSNHKSDACRFKDESCRNCGKRGHIAAVCRSTSKQQPLKPQTQQRLQSTTKKQQPNKNHKVSMDFVKIGKMSRWSARRQSADGTIYEAAIRVNGREMRLEFDTGAAATVFSEEDWIRMGKPPLSVTSLPLKDFSGNRLKLKGETIVEVEYKGKSAKLPLIVGQQKDSVIGRKWIRKLEMCNCSLSVARNSMMHQKPGEDEGSQPVHALLEEFAEIFEEGLGHCNRVKAHLELKNDVRPRFIKARMLPYAVHSAVDAELDRLVAQGVLKPVNRAEWAAPIVIASKPGGKIRLCADFSTGLNDALDIDQYPLPRPDDLYQKINGGKVFSKIDLSDAYLQLELDDASKKLVVINTHRGLFQYNRLPFGVASAPAIYQQVMDQMLVGLQGVGAYLDDIIVAGANEAEHDRRLRQVLQRIAEFGFRVKKEKCEWKEPRVKYLGFILDADGLHANPQKTQAVTSMPPPKNLAQLRSFLGMVNYYGKFLPNMSDRLAPLYQLLKKDGNDKPVKYDWSAACQRSFERIIHALSSPLMLTHYRPELPIVLAADASSEGIGAVLSHRLPDGRELPIGYASKTLTPTEARYPQIEREALALIFGIRKFHQFVWGRRFILQTDHQPLVRIFGSKQGLPTTAANRLQNYGIILMSYAFDIEYVNTSKFGKADGLSRLPLDTDHDEDVQPTIKKIDFDLRDTYTQVFADLPIKAEQVRIATAADEILKAVMALHRQGWPERLTSKFKSTGSTVTANMLKPYFRIRNELAIANDCLLWGLRIIIPKSLRKNVLDQLHKTHPGQTTMKRLSRQWFWWPGLDEDIGQTTARCDACKKVLNNTPKAPLQPWPAALRPWQRIHIDFAGLTSTRCGSS